MRYAYVQNGQIIDGPRVLPSAWENITGFDKMDLESLLALGWLPWEFIEVPVGPNQVLDGSTVEIFTDKVVETQIVRDMTPGEIQNLKDQYNNNQKENRLIAYESESDPLFFKWQRGESNQEEWLAKIEEIKQRYPYEE